MGEDGAKKKKVAMLGGAFILVIAVVGTVAATLSVRHPSSSSATAAEPSASVKSIQSICQPTDYQQTCVNALTSIASNTTDPKELIQAAFQATVNHIHQAINQSSTLNALAKDKSTAGALENCKELLDYAIDDLKNSIDKITAIDLQSIDTAVDDLGIWLSAVVTYQETCMDGFDNVTIPAAVSMRQALNVSRQLTVNALAIVDELSGVLDEMEIPGASRRLLSETDGVPSWMSATGRSLLQASGGAVKADIIVAKDGSGKFTTIQEALNAAPQKSHRPFVIYVKEGVYNEKVMVDKFHPNIVMVGDGPTKTKITGSLNFIAGTKTFNTATLTVVGNMFIMKNMGVENTAGAAGHQAVALLVQSDKSVFYNCQIDGYQDTLYAHSHRQFYRECTISGTIDFIFGDAASYFQNCLIIVRKPLDNQQNIVTAQGRTARREKSAIILHNCTVTADPLLEPVKTKLPSYLGRPWKDFSRTYYIQCTLGDLIHPDGWLPWDGTMYLSTLLYSEFDNRGPGADTSKRVKWPGIKPTDYAKAQKLFTTETFFRGGTWLPATGVPFTPGLLPLAESDRIH